MTKTTWHVPNPIARLMDEIQANPGDDPMTHEQFTTLRDQLRAAVPPDVRRAVIDRMQTTMDALAGLIRRRASQMSDERLAEIEAAMDMLAATGARQLTVHRYVIDLAAEVRRLQRENHLLRLSRGTPSIVGGD